jgi:hypothetical protein
MTLATTTRRRGSTEARQDDPEHWLLAGHYDPDFVSAVDAELDELSRLGPNWDGYGAPPIDRGITAAAKQFIRDLPPNLVYRPRVVPMSTGGLQFEWHQGPKILELELEDARTVRYLQWDPGHSVKEEETFRAADIDRAVELIQWFMSGTCV